MNKIYYVGSEPVEGVEMATMDDVIDMLNGEETVELDTETTGLDPHTDKILVIQLGDGKGNAFVIEAYQSTLKMLKPYLESPEKLYIGHNIKFDYKMLKASGITLVNVYDTMVMECLLNGGGRDASYSLEVIAGRYAGVILDKTVRTEFIGMRLPLTKRQIDYSGEDVLHLHKIRDRQVTRIKELQLEYLAELENNTVLTLGDIEFNGIILDVTQQREILRLTKIKVKQCLKDLDSIVLSDHRLRKFRIEEVQGNLFDFEERNVSLDYNSPVQVVKALNLIGFDLKSSNANQILKFYEKSPFVKALVDYRENAKILSTYGEKLISNVNKNTGRIHCDFWQLVETGRVACSKPNLQNIPKEDLHRSAWVARKGYKIIGADLAGIELKLIAEGSKDPALIKFFNDGGDVHSEVAAMVFKIAADKARETPDFLHGKSYRDVAKTISYALAYGATEYKLAQTLSITAEAAKVILNDYFAAFPRIKKFLDRLAQIGMKKGQIRSFPPTRRVRFFRDFDMPGLTDERRAEIGRQAMNAPMQACCADAVKVAMVMMRSEINKNRYPVFLINSIHDEVLTEVKEDFVPTWKPIMETIMCDAGRLFIKSVPVTVDCVVGDSWMKEKEPKEKTA